MRKILICLFVICLWAPSFANAEGVIQNITMSQLSARSFTQATFDNLVLDFVIPDNAGKFDELQALSVKSIDMIRTVSVEKLRLYADAGPAGFQGVGEDTDLGAADFNQLAKSWVWDNLNLVVPISGLHLYVTLETDSYVDGKIPLQFYLPAYKDMNNDGDFDLKDEGIFVVSKRPLPQGDQLNQSFIYLENAIADKLAPKIWAVSPLENQKIVSARQTFKIDAKDQGIAGVRQVWVGLNGKKWPAVKKGEYWEFTWYGYANGNYEFQLFGVDKAGNSGVDSANKLHLSVGLDGKFESWLRADGSSAVYLLDKDNIKHAYPTENVWLSYWGKNFSRIRLVSESELINYKTGKNVLFKEGTLVRVIPGNKVYRVGASGELSWIINEKTAIRLYGKKWAQSVKLLPQTFINDYKFGKNIQ